MADVTIPTWSAETLVTSLVTPNTLTLTWSGASDDVAVTTYRVYRGSTPIGDVTAPTVTLAITGLRPGTTYTFSVQALDAAGNASTDGPSIQATTKVADYLRLLLKGVYSANTDYSDPKVIFEPSPYSVMPTEFIKMTVEGEVSAGSTIDTSIFNSISLLMVKNLDTAQTLQLVIGNATHDNPGEGEGMTTRIAPGGIFVTTDVIAAGKVNVGEISGSGDGVIMCEVFVAGS